MKSYINKIMLGVAACSAVVFTSCKGDYLDTVPTESVSTATAVGTAENAYKALNGIAKSMSTQQHAWSLGCAGENRVISIYENYMSQDYLYNAFASGWSPIMNLKYSTRYNSSYAAYPWYYYYTIIGQANSIIANIDGAEGSEDLKNFDKAAALTFRAYGFEKLMHYYCPRWQDSNNGAAEGVVLRLDESTGAQAPATMAEVYAQIYKDCEEAIALFNSSSETRPAKEVWMPNLNVAHAVIARAALTRQDYATALSHAKQARAGFPLMSVADYQAGFAKPTSEWIMGSYGDASENNWYWSYGTQFSANGYYANNAGYGGGQISESLASQIPNNDARKALFITADKFPEFNFSDANVVERSEGYVVSEGLWSEIRAYMDNLHEATTSGYDAPYKGGDFHWGDQLKFFVFDTPGVSYLPFIRSSEMVLIEAEANYFLGNAAAAQAALVELNASTGRNPEYTCEKSGADLLKEIQNYRSLELWGEGFQFSDFKRWNLDLVRNGFDKGNNVPAPTAVTVKSTDDGWTWAIPQNETDYNDAYGNSADKSGK